MATYSFINKPKNNQQIVRGDQPNRFAPAGVTLQQVTDNGSTTTNVITALSVIETTPTLLKLDNTTPQTITNLPTVTAVASDYVLINDTSDSGKLKKSLKSDFDSPFQVASNIITPATTDDTLDMTSTVVPTDNITGTVSTFTATDGYYGYFLPNAVYKAYIYGYDGTTKLYSQNAIETLEIDTTVPPYSSYYTIYFTLNITGSNYTKFKVKLVDITNATDYWYSSDTNNMIIDGYYGNVTESDNVLTPNYYHEKEYEISASGIKTDLISPNLKAFIKAPSPFEKLTVKEGVSQIIGATTYELAKIDGSNTLYGVTATGDYGTNNLIIGINNATNPSVKGYNSIIGNGNFNSSTGAVNYNTVYGRDNGRYVTENITSNIIFGGNNAPSPRNFSNNLFFGNNIGYNGISLTESVILGNNGLWNVRFSDESVAIGNQSKFGGTAYNEFLISPVSARYTGMLWGRMGFSWLNMATSLPKVTINGHTAITDFDETTSGPQSLGSEMLTAPSDMSNSAWVKGASWTNGNKTVGGSDTLSQPIANMVTAPVVGEWYWVTIVGNSQVGNFLFTFGGDVVTTAYGSGTTSTTTYVGRVMCSDATAPFTVLSNGSTIGSISSVSIKRFGVTKDADMRVYGNVRAQNFEADDGSAGATGSFTSADSKTITVKNGIITSIV